MGIKVPNFFILGAAKCGTTTLYHALCQHPAVFFPAIKEPTFFCESYQVVRNPIEYFRLFEGVKSEVVVGDASHAYLTDPETAPVLNALFPNALFIVILRNPVDRAYSLYHHMTRSGWENIGTFEKALLVEERRFQAWGERALGQQYLYNYMYYRSGLYGEQVGRYLSLFDRRQFLFLTLDQLKCDVEDTLREIYSFLCVDEQFQAKTSARKIGQYGAKVPFLQYSIRMIADVLGIGGTKIIKKASAYNLKEVPPMNFHTRRMLAEKYESDQEKLHRLVGMRFEFS